MSPRFTCDVSRRVVASESVGVLRPVNAWNLDQLPARQLVYFDNFVYFYRYHEQMEGTGEGTQGRARFWHPVPVPVPVPVQVTRIGSG